MRWNKRVLAVLVLASCSEPPRHAGLSSPEEPAAAAPTPASTANANANAIATATQTGSVISTATATTSATSTATGTAVASATANATATATSTQTSTTEPPRPAATSTSTSTANNVTTCGFTSYGGFCWYAFESSCSDGCAAHGGYNRAGEDLMSFENCPKVANALGLKFDKVRVFNSSGESTAKSEKGECTHMRDPFESNGGPVDNWPFMLSIVQSNPETESGYNSNSGPLAIKWTRICSCNK